MTLHISIEEVEQALREWLDRKGFQKGTLKAKLNGPWPDELLFDGYELTFPEEES